MHPLRFPNSGFKAKVFVRIIGFKLRVMRLNRVELFYALVAAIGNKSRRCLRGRGDHMLAVCIQRWLATARPFAGAIGHGLATCKGRPPAGAAACKGWPPAGTVGSGQPTRGCRPRLALPPTRAATSVARVACSAVVYAGRRRRRRRSEGKGRGLGHPFEKRMIIPL
ncbi:hypothetical protein GW17_00006692 [Ensete ventricosum]|nr:hypothetical protein GW17_00006692 [Ensete ventricosum]